MSRSSGRVLKLTGILMFMELGVRLMDSIVSVILARYLEPQGLGLLAFSISFASLFGIIPGFGMGSMSTRDIAQNPDQMAQYVSNGFIAKVFLAGITMILMGSIAMFSGFPPIKAWAVILAGLLMIAETNLTYALSFFRAFQKMGTVAIINLSVRVVWVICSLIIVLFHGNVLPLLGIRVVITSLGLVGAVIYIHKRFRRLEWHCNYDFIIKMLKASFPFALFGLYGSLYMDIDTTMLSVMRGDVMTGWYAAAQKFLRVLTFMPNSFCAAMLPVLAQAHGDHEEVSRTIARSCKYLLMMSLPIAAGVSVLAPQIVALLYGPKYGGTIPALRILIWATPFSFMNGALIVALAAVNHEKQGSHCLITGALFSSLSNFLVIPLFGHVGAASTTMMAEALIAGLQVLVLRKALPTLRLWEQFPKLAGAVVIMAACVWIARPGGLIVAVPVGILSYLGGLQLLHAIDPEDWGLLRRILKKFTPPPPEETPSV